MASKALEFQSAGKGWYRGQKTWEWSFISAYPLCIFIGILVSFLSILYFWRRQKYSIEILQILLIIIVPTSIIGARLWWVISTSSWSKWYAISNGGMSIHGGVMLSGTCACLYLWSKRHVVDFRTALGIILPSVLIGQVIGRWGNFNNHEVYGAIVDGDELNWLGSWLKGHMYIAGNNGGVLHYRQPFFLYESFANFVAYALIVWLLIRKNWIKPGTGAALYLIWYGIIRLIMEPLRDPADIMHPIGDFQISTFVSIIWIIAGLILFVYFEILTMPSKWIKKHFDWLPYSKKEYEVINPIKPRRLFWFGHMSDKKKKYLFWGEELPNKVKLFLPKKERAWTKKELNAGKKFK